MVDLRLGAFGGRHPLWAEQVCEVHEVGPEDEAIDAEQVEQRGALRAEERLGRLGMQRSVRVEKSRNTFRAEAGVAIEKMEICEERSVARAQ